MHADRSGVCATPRAEPVRGADVESHEALGPVGDKTCFLCPDSKSVNVFENNAHLDMYRLAKRGGQIMLSKDIWRARADGKIVRAAYIKATWDGQRFADPNVTIARGFANCVLEGLEIEKIEWLCDTWKDAIERTEFESAG